MKIHKFIYPIDTGLPGTWWQVQLVSEFGYVVWAIHKMEFEVMRAFTNKEIDSDALEASRITSPQSPFKGFGYLKAHGKLNMSDKRRLKLEVEGWTFLESQPEYLK